MIGNRQESRWVSNPTIPTFMGKSLHYTTTNLVVMVLGVAITYFCAIPIIGGLWAFLLTLLASFAISALAKRPINKENNNTLRLAVFGLFAWLGHVLSPLIFQFIFIIPNGPLLLIGAIMATAFITFTTALYAQYTQETRQADKYILMRPLLANLVIGLIAVGILNMFFQMPIITLLYGLAGACIFTLYLLSDIILVANLHSDATVVSAEKADHDAILCGAVIALDISNIFISILEIIGVMSNKGSDMGKSITTLFMTLLGPILMLGVVFGFNEAFSASPVSKSSRAPVRSQQFVSAKPPSFCEWLMGSKDSTPAQSLVR